jgi:hypothetical protein
LFVKPVAQTGLQETGLSNATNSEENSNGPKISSLLLQKPASPKTIFNKILEMDFLLNSSNQKILSKAASL